eukprot:CAMPEP_0180324704 /NCGR_PEP_ID=MMETSP0988-20121125/38001_1 /TAXON_ID=697907 /ORGANISM="non described non described, Strain CCMP2293" /LENGTH=77 /DNA_ID=CAMNT_0022311021 /DNA_START=564 /DNA_END=798 /DNA_ORIENTATION=+
MAGGRAELDQHGCAREVSCDPMLGASAADSELMLIKRSISPPFAPENTLPSSDAERFGRTGEKGTAARAERLGRTGE